MSPQFARFNPFCCLPLSGLIVAVTMPVTPRVGAGETISATSEMRSAKVESQEQIPYESLAVPQPANYRVENRLWLISTRHLAKGVCRANLEQPALRVYRLDSCGRRRLVDVDEYLAERDPARPTVVYVHGNRMSDRNAVQRGIYVYRHVIRRYRGPAIDWVIWSWPSERSGILLADAREKAQRTDTQGLYLAWLLRNHVRANQPTALIGYSFGARVISGSLHALAGGALGRRKLPGETIVGAQFDVGMIAPALGNDWMTVRGYHRLATQNLDRISVLYNERDAILANYWRVDRLWNADALGYTGPTSFAPGVDGLRPPIRARDCSASVGIHHDEIDYYTTRCAADCEMAMLVNDALVEN